MPTLSQAAAGLVPDVTGPGPAEEWLRWVRAKPHVPAPDGGRALLISYPFPPVGGSAVQRPAKLVKYLPAAG